MTPAQKKKRVKVMYRRWLEDEKFLDEIADRPDQEYSDVQEMLRNLGSAIAYAQRFVAKVSPITSAQSEGGSNE